ncbi:deoxyribose-phosphate aldolase [candidate division KSB3 bacterium]|uniref:Deoxyribose-phosphate aldolase n=1 Tax=candidate division KSB3 bacterium TaxID=2044937 RepID=A0A2G6KH94_9BACT|nr:MAG: deoxyribose-phosphate aldolase [candidate division KSB3 bacterium]
MALQYKDLAKMLDHSLLHPTMTDTILREGCELALKYDTASVCIKPYAIPLACSVLKGSNVLVGTVIGFPHGNSTTTIKIAEAQEAARAGAAEVDMVINIGKALGEDWGYVQDEIAQINQITVGEGAILKVIFENDFLTNNHIAKLCEICGEIGVAFVKTSTGYGFIKQENGMYSYKGATLEHLKLMREKSPTNVQVKAAGGVRTLKDLVTVNLLGVSRVGATATAAMLNEATERLKHNERLEDLVEVNLSGGGH